ncbi:ribonuclease III [Acuticoccus sp. MNP-M23]|uniref:ribonuclease III n=1 Tax=Acuticoccus sp. MNP-M23 TaxID=3072793 RepID=UPI00281642EB|nr:ribonuclease III [Acuticoccus sp. MNP-M23]WMS43393.1 ribonuclease III [Acuticoccus sp. MNP-M23]
MSADPLARLESALGHRFADRGLLERAVMHASAFAQGRGESYQRLEFLGDRVLGLVIAAMLHDRYPEAEEGELARRLNALVRREACADRALFLGIDGALKLGHAEAHSGGRKKAAILADACEAVLAAVYLDAGYDAAQAVILNVWAPLIETDERPERDPKTALQERVQANGGPPPDYVLLERRGPDHKPHFVIEVVNHSGPLGRGEGGSKREAEQNAARAALAGLGAAIDA